MRYLVVAILVLIAAVSGFFIIKSEYENKIRFAEQRGYLEGQIELLRELKAELNTPDYTPETKHSYHHVKSVKHMTVYVFEKDGLRSLYIDE